MDAEQYRWYIIHVLSGFEKKVVQSIKEQSEKKKVATDFEQIVIPTEEVLEIRKGKKINAEKKVLPGYILVKMKMNDTTWHIVKDIPKVTGFLGVGSRPQPVSELEVKKIFDQIKEGVNTNKHLVSYEIGESVKIIDGPFDSFIGVVEGIDEEKSRLKVSVSIFGRSTPVELEYTQVTKYNS